MDCTRLRQRTNSLGTGDIWLTSRIGVVCGVAGGRELLVISGWLYRGNRGVSATMRCGRKDSGRDRSLLRCPGRDYCNTDLLFVMGELPLFQHRVFAGPAIF